MALNYFHIINADQIINIYIVFRRKNKMVPSSYNLNSTEQDNGMKNVTPAEKIMLYKNSGKLIFLFFYSKIIQLLSQFCRINNGLPKFFIVGGR